MTPAMSETQDHSFCISQSLLGFSPWQRKELLLILTDTFYLLYLVTLRGTVQSSLVGNDNFFSTFPEHLLSMPSISYLLPPLEGSLLQMHLLHLSNSMDWFHVLLFGDLHSH